MKKEFQGYSSLKTKIITLLFNLIGLAVVYLLLFREDLLKDSNQPPDSIKYIFILIILIGIIFSFGFHVRKYSITETSLIIHRLFYNKTIAKNQIVLAQEINYDHLSISYKMFGSGGIWGYIGIYNSNRFGPINLFATNIEEVILITTKRNKKILISPDNVAEFLQNIY